MSDKEFRELHDKIYYGLRVAEIEMLKDKAKNNENVIIEENGVIRSVPASHYLSELAV